MRSALQIIALAVFTSVLFAQSNIPHFEAASIKPNDTPGMAGTGMIRALPGGRLSVQAAIVKELIRTAYRVQRFQIVGGPDWMESARYDIEATPATTASPQQMFVMLQSLLEDRFKLQAHRETRKLPVYDLLPAKGGIKLSPPKEGSCVNPDPNGPVMPPPPPPGSKAGSAPLCGTVFGSGNPAGMHLIGGAATIPDLIRTLTGMLGRTIIDKTGYTDKFDLNIEFSFDQSLAGLSATPPSGGIPVVADTMTPSVFTALQEQSGLRLESSKGPVEVIVIDHLEKPRAN